MKQVSRRITNMYPGQKVKYNGKEYTVDKVYRNIIYLSNDKDPEPLCLGLGDLVIAGLQPSMISIRHF